MLSNSIDIKTYKKLIAKQTGKCNSKIKNEKKRKNKYNAIKSTVDNITFDSKIESTRYIVLKDREKKGLISCLNLQKKFPLNVNGLHIGFYVADFYYFCNQTKQFIIEDVKGHKTQVYQIKKKLMKACHNIDIKEITKENITL
jgi:hypothetical protein